jgi:hypothetical protein
MDLRLSLIGRRLASFLTEDLSETHLGLSFGARAHLDKFQSFLQSYYVAKFGYYPPTSYASSAFPKSTYSLMCDEFEKLYQFLVDVNNGRFNDIQFAQQGGVCVLQSLQVFDSRHKYQALPHLLPLLPESDNVPKQSSLSRRMSWISPPSQKLRSDSKLLSFASIVKATNSLEPTINDCSLVRAYQAFEKDCIFSPDKSDAKISQREARSVRWILVYSVLQTLLSVTKVPVEVRDTLDVPYNLCVQTAGCPTFEASPGSTPSNLETKEDFITLLAKVASPANNTPEIKPDMNYFETTQRTSSQPQKHPRRLKSMSSPTKPTTPRGTVRRALLSLGNMPELVHPLPRRATFHEILVPGYGNGIQDNTVSDFVPPTVPEEVQTENDDSFAGQSSSRWSDSSIDATYSRRSSGESSKESHFDLETPMSAHSHDSLAEYLASPNIVRPSSSADSTNPYLENLKPEPLRFAKTPKKENEVMLRTPVWDDDRSGSLVIT